MRFAISVLLLAALWAAPCLAAPPLPVDDLQIDFLPTGDAVLSWNAPSLDTEGNPLVVDRYLVHSSPDPHFEPDTGTLRAEVVQTSWTDAMSWDLPPRRFYRVVVEGEGHAFLSGQVAWYPFEGNADDAGGNGYHGQLLGAASAQGTLEIGDNDEDAVALPGAVFDGLQDFTIAASLRFNSLHASCPSGFTPGHSLVNCGTPMQVNTLWLMYHPPAHGWIVYVYGSHFLEIFPVPAEEWYHVTFVRQGWQVTLYYEGGETGSVGGIQPAPIDAWDGGCFLGQDQDVFGGMFEACQSLNGGMDDLRVFDRALDPGEVMQLYLLDTGGE